MPSEVSTAAGGQDLARTIDELKRELGEAHRREAATAEILSVISRSRTEAQPVFDAIVKSAVRLCDELFSGVYRFDGELLHHVAHHNYTPKALEEVQRKFPARPTREFGTGRAILEKAVVHIPDVEVDPEYRNQPISRAVGMRSGLFVPMLRDSTPVGVILVARAEPGAFSDSQINLLKSFADQAVIAIENARLFEVEQARTKELQAGSAELAQSLEYQTATSDVLNVISRSPAQVQPVLDAIAETAGRLCQAENTAIWRFAEDAFQIAAHTTSDASFAKYLAENPLPTGHESLAGRVVLARSTIHIPDVLADPVLSTRPQFRRGKTRTALGVPLLREGVPSGVIVLTRNKVLPFTKKQIELVTTFADQAVIAIENTRLFEAEQASKRELQESLEYQTAMSDVLAAISSSPNELQPVFDAIVRSASRLCGGEYAIVNRYDGKLMHLVAQYNPRPAAAEETARSFPRIARRETSMGARALLDGKILNIPDVEAEDFEQPEQPVRDFHRRIGVRALLAVPMINKGDPIGAILVSRAVPGRFSDRQVDLLRTFADQAVIAIENTRLFEAEQASKRELQESLEYQTATSDVLGVISRSPTNAQPVFDTIAQAAAQLCKAQFCYLYQFDGALIHFVAHHGLPPEWLETARRRYPMAPGRGSAAARSILNGAIEQIADVRADPDYTHAALSRTEDYRSLAAVPMLRDGRPIGTIVVGRGQVGVFPDRQIELLKTFADQAVIAIENTRLFEAEQARTGELTERTRELTESLEYQTATSDVLGVINRSKFELEPVLDTIASTASRFCAAADVIIYLKEEGQLRTVAHHGSMGMDVRKLPIARGSVAGRTIVERQPVHVDDLAAAGDEFPLGREIAAKFGHRTTLGIPLLRDEQAIGCFVLRRPIVKPFASKQIALLESFADQAVIAIENTRLFEEIAQKGRELEIASQHKSQFVANMSHELRTPLAAILGYAELMQEGFYEPQGKKSLDALTRIRSNGKHLLGLINTVLDIAKIEAGQFSLNLAEYALDNVVETVRVATESLAETKKLALKTDVAKRLPVGLGDEQRLTQVLLNLVGNAIKFTDTGEVRITATAVDGHFTVGVTDTGPGIPPEELKRVFEQFHQIDNSNTKAKGGTGLGLAIAKQIVEMHGGRIWVESTLGKGATFQMELPVRAAAAKGAA